MFSLCVNYLRENRKKTDKHDFIIYYICKRGNDTALGGRHMSQMDEDGTD